MHMTLLKRLFQNADDTILLQTMEPKTRKFKCNAEKWRAVPSNEWNFRDINDSFPYCRPGKYII